MDKVKSIIEQLRYNKYYTGSDYMLDYVNENRYVLSCTDIHYTRILHIFFESKEEAIQYPSIYRNADILDGNYKAFPFNYKNRKQMNEWDILHSQDTLIFDMKNYRECNYHRLEKLMNLESDILIKANGHQAVFIDYLLKEMILEDTYKMEMKLTGDDHPLCIHYKTVDDMECFGILAPKLIDPDNSDVTFEVK